MSKRAMIFIDGNNLYFGLKKNVGNYNLNYGKFIRAIAGKDELVRAYFYTAVFRKEDDELLFNGQQKFLSYLQEVPYMQVMPGRIEKRGDELVEKGVDVRMAIDLVRFGAKKLYDVAYIVSGDGDYAPAVNAVKDMGLNVVNCFFADEASAHLRHACDRFFRLDFDFLRDCLFASATTNFVRDGVESRDPEDVEREYWAGESDDER
ncbi:MAG TPA: NYN domain-containing protein [candidate division Zixibacteria bacterium]|mgnify:CR=1 FL=1|nr:NYN domain-containing protein [candidate division Zixibacteria bacterium]